MKITFHFNRLQGILSIFCLILIAACIVISPACGDENTSVASVSADHVSAEYATGFHVEYRDGYKIVTVTNPWRGSNDSFTYVLVPEGTNPPELQKNEKIISIPVKRFVALSSTYLAYLPILGVTDSLVGVKGTDIVSTPEVRSMIEEGKVIDVSGGGAGMGSDVNLETLLDLSPDLVMTYATGQAEYDTHPKLEEAGIPVALNGEYMEQDPLGRAEWIKYVSVFFNKEKEANEYFETIKNQYNSLKKSAASENNPKPTVFLNNNYQGTWFMAGGDSFVAKYLNDAGAEYLWANDTTTGSIPLDFEVVYDTALNADFWLNPGTANSIKELMSQDARYFDFKAMKSKKVYNSNARVNANGGNDYWESGVVHPEIVLKDLVKIFHPNLVPDHTLYYYKHLE